jgi:hypothetical protein
MTFYQVTNNHTGRVTRELLLDEAARIVQLDEHELKWAITEHGVCEVEYYSVREEEHPLIQLARTARPINDADWGSARQVAAENQFFASIKPLISASDWDELETFALRATTDERIDFALRLVDLVDEVNQ